MIVIGLAHPNECVEGLERSVVSITQVVLSELRVTGKNPQKQASFKSLKQRCSFFCIKMCRCHMLWSPIRALPVLEGLKKEDNKGEKMP